MIHKKQIPLYISGIMLAVATLHMPYGYYILLRIVIFATLIYIAICTDDALFLISIILAIVYNPIFYLPLGRPLWTVINIATIIFFVIVVIWWKKNPQKSTQ